MRILNVDDNQSNLYFLEALLGAHGHRVVSANNGVDALRKLEDGEFDLIVTDILMPEMDGFQLCREVKSRDRLKRIPVIVYTATYTSRQDEEFAMSLGASRFIIKPAEPEQFMKIVAAVVGERERGDVETEARETEPQPDSDYLRVYNQRLVHKLERKVEQLEAASRELKTTVAERLKLEAQLAEVRKMESVGRLAGGIAHDFNNLLTVINGYSELLRAELPPGSAASEKLAQIRRAGERAAELTAQLLAFSRNQKTVEGPVNLNRVIDENLSILRRLVGDDIEVVTDLDPALGLAMGDSGNFLQVLMNLAANARDAMAGGGTLTIATGNANPETRPPGLAPGELVRLSVSDTGSGMDEGILAEIFDPFFTTKAGGTGLGLFTVAGIVKRSGGEICVQSGPGGTTFDILLPRLNRGEAAAPSRKPPAGADAARGTETILVVDDRTDVRGLVVARLRQGGYRVLEAESGGDALRISDDNPGPIDLLLTDLLMPKMSGKELASEMGRRRPAMKVLFMSGVQPADADGPDASHFILKPFSDDLLMKIRGILDSAFGEFSVAGGNR